MLPVASLNVSMCMYVYKIPPLLFCSVGQEPFETALSTTISTQTMERKLWTRLWITHTLQKYGDQQTSLESWLSWSKRFYQHSVKSTCLPTLNRAVWIASTRTAFLSTYTTGQRQPYYTAWTEKLRVLVSQLLISLLLIAAKALLKSRAVTKPIQWTSKLPCAAVKTGHRDITLASIRLQFSTCIPIGIGITCPRHTWTVPSWALIRMHSTSTLVIVVLWILPRTRVWKVLPTVTRPWKMRMITASSLRQLFLGQR